MASITLADLERLDRVARMILAGDSQCFWFLSALLAQLKEDGYQPSNPTLFDKSISSLYKPTGAPAVFVNPGPGYPLFENRGWSRGL